MRVVIEVTSGPACGKKAFLKANQVLSVGRTERADFVVPTDGSMSSKHFALETENSACYITDLGSTNGTSVDHRTVDKRTPIKDGSEIRAGHTAFTVRIQGAAAAAPEAEIAVGVSTPADAAGAPREPRSYMLEACDSGLMLCRGEIDCVAPSQLALELSRVLPAYLIVDFKKLAVPKPEELAAPAYLFDWLAPPAAELVSPLLMGHKDLTTWPTLLDQGWGGDCVVGLFSQQEPAGLLAHLRSMLRHGPAESQSKGVLGFCWPSVMTPLLTHCRMPLVKELMSGITAVLVELPDLPDTWQLFGDDRAAKLLDQLGFEQRPPDTVLGDEPATKP